MNELGDLTDIFCDYILTYDRAKLLDSLRVQLWRAHVYGQACATAVVNDQPYLEGELRIAWRSAQRALMCLDLLACS